VDVLERPTIAISTVHPGVSKPGRTQSLTAFAQYTVNIPSYKMAWQRDLSAHGHTEIERIYTSLPHHN
jgi:hypothetical protein